MENHAQNPDLPQEIIVDQRSDGPLSNLRRPELQNNYQRFTPIFTIKSLKKGAYFMQWRPKGLFWTRYNGTMRIERHGSGVTASGDFYRHNAYTFKSWPTFQIVPNPDPSPSAGIPIFRRSNYECYLRVTQILEFYTFGNSFTMKFEKYDFDTATNSWTNAGLHSAVMSFKTAPSSFPSGATYLEGTLKSPSGVDLGTITMGWVSKYLRKASLEIDRVSASEYPGSNGSGLDWKDVFKAVDWDLNAYQSDTNLTEPSGQSWSDAELHSAMLARRDSSDLDNEWRYHILAVRRLDSTSRGIMYDAFSGDSNNIPREGAAVSSHWTIPNTNTWGTVRGMRFGDADAPYFRTAVHELGHALGLYHNTADNGFMNTTGTIASSPGTFPSNIQWSFNAADAKRLRHMPDPWVRPGVIPFGSSYASAPISPTDAMDLGGPLELRIEPLLDAVPIGAPVRVKMTLTNHSDSAIEVPDHLTLKSEHVTGIVSDPNQTRRSFRSLMRCIEEHEVTVLKPGAKMTGDMTLLRGLDGALFSTPGLHNIAVNLSWEISGITVNVAGSNSVMITPPVDDAHAVAAKATLSEPDLLLTLAIGGDHLEEGIAALDAAMANSVLAPHFAIVKAKQAGRRFGKRKASPSDALKALGSRPVLSQEEANRVAELLDGAPATVLKKAPKTLGKALATASDGNKSVKKIADEMSA